jgi:hypothetical protein
MIKFLSFLEDKYGNFSEPISNCIITAGVNQMHYEKVIAYMKQYDNADLVKWGKRLDKIYELNTCNSKIPAIPSTILSSRSSVIDKDSLVIPSEKVSEQSLLSELNVTYGLLGQKQKVNVEKNKILDDINAINKFLKDPFKASNQILIEWKHRLEEQYSIFLFKSSLMFQFKLLCR